MKWFLEMIGRATAKSSDALFDAMDLAYGLGGESLLPPLLGMVSMVAIAATILAPA